MSHKKSIQHLRWNASQGHVESMKELVSRAEVTEEEKAWWKYKIEGGKAFSPDSIEYLNHGGKP
jgi:hypothetical protein